MSLLLTVAIVLLVLVVGLALLQRRQTRDLTARPGVAVAAPRVAPTGDAAAAAGEDVAQFAFAKDDLLGVISYDEGVWTADDEAPFAEAAVIVEVHGHKAGLTEAQSEIVRLALKYPRDLDARARAVIQQELDRRGIADATMEAYELTVRPRDDGREAGFLWYDVAHADREMGVSSVDGWKTLQLESRD